MLIAVYGTLRKGCFWHSLLEDSKFLGEAKIPGYIIAFDGLPKAIKDDKSEIVVEVYDVDDEFFKELNRFETEAGYKAVYVDTPFGEAILWEWPREVDTGTYTRDFCELMAV